MSKCPRCKYEWPNRNDNPKECPRCKGRLDNPRKRFSVRKANYDSTEHKKGVPGPPPKYIARRFVLSVILIATMLVAPILVFIRDGTVASQNEDNVLSGTETLKLNTVLGDNSHSSYIWVCSTDDFVYQRNAFDFSDAGALWDTLHSNPSGLEYLPENNRIYVVDPGSGVDALICYTTGGVEEWRFDAPGGDSYDLARANGYWWIADRGDDKVYKVDNGGTMVADFTATTFKYIEGLAWDGNYLWVADEGDADFLAFDVSGVVSGSYSLSPVVTFTVTGSTAPTGMAWDGEYFWVSDSDEDYVWKVDNTGTIIAGPWAFTDPEGLAYDPTAGHTFGYKTKGGDQRQLSVNQMRGSWSTTPTENVTLISIIAYFKQYDSTNPKIKTAVYTYEDGGDSQLVGYSEEWTIPDGWDNWKTFNIISGGNLENDKKYWLWFWIEGNYVYVYFTVESQKGSEVVHAYNGWPDTKVPAFYNKMYSIYGTYTLLTRPVLVSPENATEISDNNTPTFLWENGANTENHRIEVDDDINFGSPEDNVTVFDNTWTKGGDGYADGTYYWRVWAVDKEGELMSENTWQFTITVTVEQWNLTETWTGTVEAPSAWQLIETWTGTIQAPAAWQLIETWTGAVEAPVEWQLIETWTGTIKAPIEWQLIETWDGTVQAPVEWQLIEEWTGTVEAFVGWQLIETWIGTVQALAEWQTIETWTGTIEAPVVWKLIEAWTGIVEAPAVWQLIETWTGAVEAPAEWWLIETWTGTVQAPAEWQLIETWTGTVEAPAAWQLIETWTDTVKAPAAWQLIEEWTGTVEAPVAWQLIETWTGTIEAPAAWQLIETWTGTVETPAVWQVVETWAGAIEAPAVWQLIETWTGDVSAPAQWQLIETWTGTVEAPVGWQLIEEWTGTIEAPVEWQLIETWDGTVQAPVEWQLIEEWTGTIEAFAEWELIETWTGTIEAPAEWRLIKTWTGTVEAPTEWQLIETWDGTINAPAAWYLIESWDGTIQTPAAWQLIESWDGDIEAPAEWNLVESWTGTIEAYTQWRLIDTWSGSVQAPAEWMSIETWTGTLSAPAEWRLLETWSGTVEAPVEWKLIESWSGIVGAPAIWQLVESWVGTVEAPANWVLIETWDGTITAPAEWQGIESWGGTISAPAEWQIIESWSGTVSAPIQWQLIEEWTGTVEVPEEFVWNLIETWTGTVNAPAVWGLIESWAGAINAPAEWYLVEEWAGKVEAPANWQLIETWIGTVEAPAIWQMIETWTGTVSAPAEWQLVETWIGTAQTPSAEEPPPDTTPPPVPSLISPADNSILPDNTPTFNWSDVTDPSGVTYTFEILGVLTKSGLVSSACTLANDEALSDGNYYWRVRAVDGAGNPSDWSSVWWFVIKAAAEVTTDPATSITTSGAVLNATIWYGVYGSVDIRFEYRIVGGAWTDTPWDEGYTGAEYSKGVSGLYAGTIHEFKAHIKYDGLEDYGDIRTFKTKTVYVPPPWEEEPPPPPVVYDVRLDAYPERVPRCKAVTLRIDVYRVQGQGTVDVIVSYKITDEAGNVYAQGKFTEAIYAKIYELPFYTFWPLGVYTADVGISWPGGTAEAADTFEVVEVSIIERLNLVPIILIVAVVIVMVILIYLRKKRFS